jgi:hypothetical protein
MRWQNCGAAIVCHLDELNLWCAFEATQVRAPVIPPVGEFGADAIVGDHIAGVPGRGA